MTLAVTLIPSIVPIFTVSPRLTMIWTLSNDPHDCSAPAMTLP